MANYPASLSTNANLYVAVNGLQTTLAVACTSGDTTLTLTSTTGFPSTGLVTIDNTEIVSYTGISGATITGCTRGADGTVAASHPIGVTVGATVVAAHHNLLKDEVIAIETALGVNLGNILPVNLATQVTGILPNANTTATPNATASTIMSRDANANVKVNTLVENFSTTVTAAGTTNLTASSSPLQQFTGTTTQNVVLPDATTLSIGYQISVLNRSTGSVTVKNNGGTALVTITANAQTTFTVTNISTANGVWDASTSSGGSAVVQYVRYIVGTATGSYSGSTTVFDVPFAYVQDGKSMQVFYNGQMLSGSNYSETSTTQVTMSTALVVGSEVVFRTINSGANSTAVTFLRENYIVGTSSGSYTGSLTVFNLTNTYTPGGTNLKVYLDGDLQTLGAGIDYLETSSSIVTFNNALVAGQKVSFIFSQSAAPAGTVSNGTSGQLAVYASTGVTVSGSNSVDQGASPTSGQLTFKAGGAGALSILSFSADNQQLGFDTEWSGSADIARNASAYALVKNGAALNVTGNTGLTPGNSFSKTTIATLKPTGCSFNGTNTNDSAAAGQIGQYISSFAQVSAGSFAASSVWFNITSISLTAGDWDVSGITTFEAGPSASNTATGTAISVNSGNTTTDQVLGDNMAQGGATVANTSNVTLTIPTYRISLNATTTIFLKTQLTYSTNTGMRIDGRISARRAR